MVRRISGLDDLARIFFPDNRNHRRAFAAIWLAIKYAERQFLPDMAPIETQYDLSRRTVENVRAKMKKLGLIRRVSHFSPENGYRAGWVFSDRFSRALGLLGKELKQATNPSATLSGARKDRDSLLYV